MKSIAITVRDMTGGPTFTTSRSSPPELSLSQWDSEMEELPVAAVPEELG
jgi:hypothetical protein